MNCTSQKILLCHEEFQIPHQFVPYCLQLPFLTSQRIVGVQHKDAMLLYLGFLYQSGDASFDSFWSLGQPKTLK